MTLNPEDIPVYSGSAFAKVNSITCGAVHLKKNKKMHPEQLDEVFKELLDKIYRDPLTKLPNYESFQESLVKHIEKRERKKAHNVAHPNSPKEIPPDTVLYIDMNYMGLINKEIGHKCTDRLIAAVGETIHDFFRKADKEVKSGADKRVERKPKEDIVARAYLAGDEFLVLLKGCSRDNAKRRCDELFKTLQKKIFIIPDERHPKRSHVIKNVSLAFGYHELDYKLGNELDRDHDTADTAIVKADTRMKDRKERWKKQKDPEKLSITEPMFYKVKANDVEQYLHNVEACDIISLPKHERGMSRG